MEMEIDTEQALSSLREVAGVEGTFLVNSTGAFSAWNMSGAVEEDVLDEARAKLVRLRQAFAVSGQQLDFCTVRFSNYKLCLKASELGIICVLTRPDVNLAVLRMALRMLLSRIEGRPRSQVAGSRSAREVEEQDLAPVG